MFGPTLDVSNAEGQRRGNADAEKARERRNKERALLAWAYTRPLVSSTSAVLLKLSLLVWGPFCVML